jgi:hypothetical protein
MAPLNETKNMRIIAASFGLYGANIPQQRHFVVDSNDCEGYERARKLRHLDFADSLSSLERSHNH